MIKALAFIFPRWIECTARALSLSHALGYEINIPQEDRNMPTLFIVRAQIRDATDRPAFDHWYQEEHLPDALKAFKARRAFRGWSPVDPTVHCAFYEFDTLANAQAIQGTESLKQLIAEFDRCWGDKVSRSRDMVEIVQTLNA